MSMVDWNNVSIITIMLLQEFQELWPLLDLIIDGGEIITDGPHARKGSTVVNLSVPGYFSIIREGRFVFIVPMH